MTQRLLDPRARRGPGRRLPAVRLPARARQHAGRLGAERRRRRRDPPRGRRERVDAFLRELRARRRPPRASRRSTSMPRRPAGSTTSSSAPAGAATSPRPRISPDLAVCARCLARAVRSRRSALSAIRTSTAPTAARATRSSCGCPTTAPRPRWRRGRWTHAVRARVSRPGEPPVPRAAGGVSGLRPRHTSLRDRRRRR